MRVETPPPADPPVDPPADPPAPVEPPDVRERAVARRERGRIGKVALTLWWLVVVAGLGAVVVSALTDLGSDQISRGGSAAVASAYAAALAVRTGGRPWVFGALAVLLGGCVVALDIEVLTTGAAVMTAVVTAVLSVMLTVPAVRVKDAARESLIALVFAWIGGIAVVGFEPTIALLRFEYTALMLSLAFALALVYRLGAGLHGLGRRGILTVLVGTAVLAGTLLYAELLRRYGTPGLVTSMDEAVHWSRDHLMAFPRPIEAVLGIPALTWGCHMRARRRQGWWVCVFGVAATAPVATGLLNTSVTGLETVLASVYALVVGLLLGALLIRVDLRLTAPKGRRGRRAEEATAIRPEPTRSQPLL